MKQVTFIPEIPCKKPSAISWRISNRADTSQILAIIFSSSVDSGVLIRG
jgi:hypothetical protein